MMRWARGQDWEDSEEGVYVRQARSMALASILMLLDARVRKKSC